ncbi:replicative DNA helicase [Nocardia brasiliensis]|uniref:replicative DNA helicase n=1 Tax=Nocardia brasiliensis TaxID=37326 RepID=UPI0018957E7C|nr:replicative DNA helicase [Nocardia brasiliensis]MBF6546824.1 replicative DNA helicase [Nocardia brasiliensis]
MAVVDDRGHADFPPEPPGEDFGRQPPHDMAAEQSVLGGMLLSKDAIADVIEVMRPGDFYRPAHQAVYDTILDLYGRGEPADPVTVAAGLDRRGELKRIGGPPYLVTLTQTVPTAANASFYAEIVAEKAILRRLVEAGTRIVQYGYAGADGQDIAEVVDRAQAEVYEVTERRTTEDFLPLEELLQPTMDEIDSIASRGGISLGVPTGFTELDELTNGLHPGQMIIVAARPGVGKALALDTPLPTPTGWTTMGEVRVGDELLDAAGRPTRVVAATDTLSDRPCYEVEFSDGTVLVADEEHQWLTETRASRKSAHEAASGKHSQRTFAAIRTTGEIARTLRCSTADRRINHSVINAQPLQLPARDLLVPPYTLGAWLGDGTSATAQLTTADPEIVARIEAEGLIAVPSATARLRYCLQLPADEPIAARVCVVCGAEFVPFTSEVRTCGRSCGGKARLHSAPVPAPTCTHCGGPSIGLRLCQSCRNAFGSVQARLRTIGVLGDKHIPVAYLRASEQQRRALLAGLLDTDGTVTHGGSVQFAVTSERLFRDVQELVVSLGYRCHVSTKRVRGRSESSSVAYTMTFATDDEVFGLYRKALLHKERRAARNTARSGSRYIVDVRRIESVPVRCVEVDNADHLYLAGRSMVPTHNSTLGMDFMRSCSIKHGLPSVIFSLEMSRTEIVMRLLSAEAKIKLGDMRAGRMSDDDWTKLARRMSEISEAPLFVDDSPNLTMMEIRAKARRLKQRHDLKLVVVDYLQLMTSGKKVESRQQEVSDFSRNLKLLAKELEVPVVAISQLNRGPEQRTDKRPMVSDLRESGCLPASTRILRADNGTESTLGELLASGEQPLVWSLDERMRMVARPMVKVFPSGRKEVFRLRLASGRVVDATGNHPFLTVDGWIALEKLAVGDRLATPRHVPEPVHTTRMPDAEIILLAHMIGDGSCVERQPLRYASIDEANLDAVTAAATHFGVTAVRDDYPAARVSTLRLRAPEHLTHGKRNPIAAWLDELGLFGLRSYEKFVPKPIFELPNDQVALFLRHLWATDGSVRWDDTGRQARVYYSSTSRRLIDDVAQLLLRVGVHGRIKQVRKAGYRDCWHLTVDGSDNQTVFLRDVGVHGARGQAADAALTHLAPLARNTNVDTVPKEVWNQVRSLLTTKQMTHREFSAAMGSRFCGSTMWKRSPSRSRLARVAVVLDDADIEMLATNDVFWDKIVEITSLGEQDVYDGTVPGTHNFVAQGISVHNSLEQDADMVILLHRPDAFERDDPRGGEADLILGKHRNGPTATITVAHQLHLSRFVDMARG